MRYAILVLLFGCSSDGDSFGETRSAALEQTNALRATVGKPALVETAELTSYANAGAQFDHGASPHDHFRQTSGGGVAGAENECPHWPNGADLDETVKNCIDAFWSEGPGEDYSMHGHYINMTGNYTTMGLGIFVAGDSVTIVQDFGQ